MLPAIMNEQRQRGPDRRRAPRGGRRPGDGPGLHPTVMVVEDEPGLRRLLVRHLSRHRFRVEEAGNGLAALARIREAPPDLILTDLSMPGLGGAALVEQLRSAEHTRQIPVVIYSSDRAGAELAPRLAHAAFVKKPAESQDLLAGIRQVLRSPGAPLR